MIAPLYENLTAVIKHLEDHGFSFKAARDDDHDTDTPPLPKLIASWWSIEFRGEQLKLTLHMENNKVYKALDLSHPDSFTTLTNILKNLQQARDTVTKLKNKINAVHEKFEADTGASVWLPDLFRHSGSSR